ncbi:ABC transporter substrate-binding protein [Mageeibacillus indolicus]|uniref:ABC transporter substrate-binding protein n=1 Tax=Mageeibacillus indolicus TaxID=884684 RepID=UPI00068F47B8|nr:ABC transporter substrate-binding protein [Mageeibacillus indolicus]
MKRSLRLKFWLCLWTCLLTACGSLSGHIAVSDVPHPVDSLTVYTSYPASIYAPIIKEFQYKTGIWVEPVEGEAIDLLERIKAEAPTPTADVMFGGGVDTLLAYKEFFAVYETPETLNFLLHSKPYEKIVTPFLINPLVFVYNPRLVGLTELFGWNDLLNPAFKGRIAMGDPMNCAIYYTVLQTFLAINSEKYEKNIAALLLNLKGKLYDSEAAVGEAVASDEKALGILSEAAAYELQARNKDIQIFYPPDGTTVVPDGSAIVKNSAHAAAAAKFIDYLSSLPVQRYLAENARRRTVRKALPDPAGRPSYRELKLRGYDIQQAASQQRLVAKLWRSIAGRVAEK